MKIEKVENKKIDDLKTMFDNDNNRFVRYIDESRGLRYDFTSNTKSGDNTSFHSVKMIVYKNNVMMASVFWSSIGKLITYLKSRKYQK